MAGFGRRRLHRHQSRLGRRHLRIRRPFYVVVIVNSGCKDIVSLALEQRLLLQRSDVTILIILISLQKDFSIGDVRNSVRWGVRLVSMSGMATLDTVTRNA